MEEFMKKADSFEADEKKKKMNNLLNMLDNKAELPDVIIYYRIPRFIS